MLSKYEKLQQLHQTIKKCTQCSLREQCRVGPVPGEGHSMSRLVIVGMNPGNDEDLLERPFVGRCGLLLDKMLGEVGIDRKKVYITNVVKCRTPKNTEPGPRPTTVCFPFLFDEIDIIQPKIIITMGKYATRVLTGLGTSIKMEDCIGTHQKYLHNPDITVIPCYHPSFILRGSKEAMIYNIEVLRKVKEGISE